MSSSRGNAPPASDTRAAVGMFQAKAGLDATGEPDAATRAKLVEAEWKGFTPVYPDAIQGGAFLKNRRGAANLARSRLSGGSWAMSEPSWPAQGRLKAGCSQDWLPHKAAPIFIIRCDAARVMSNLCHLCHGAGVEGG